MLRPPTSTNLHLPPSLASTQAVLHCNHVTPRTYSTSRNCYYYFNTSALQLHILHLTILPELLLLLYYRCKHSSRPPHYNQVTHRTILPEIATATFLLVLYNSISWNWKQPAVKGRRIRTHFHKLGASASAGSEKVSRCERNKERSTSTNCYVLLVLAQIAR